MRTKVKKSCFPWKAIDADVKEAPDGQADQEDEQVRIQSVDRAIDMGLTASGWH